jgi:CRISPR-associated endonuclease/helicase Cas3
MNVARVRECDGREQSLEEHLRGTAKIAETFTSEIGLEKTGELMGLLHDFGKASEKFTTYIRSAAGIYKEGTPEYKQSERGKIDHSTAGAQYLHDNYYKEDAEWFGALSLQMMELCVLSHHSGLINCLEKGVDKYSERISKSLKDTSKEEAARRIDEGLINEIIFCANVGIKSLSDLLDSIYVDLKNNMSQDDPAFSSKLYFRIGLLNRFLLSCLVDADGIDSHSFEFPDDVAMETPVDRSFWEEMKNRCESHIATLDSGTPVSRIRKNISDLCLSAASRPKGTYLLSVPTGGGKTISSLRFALSHAKEHDLKRIFYIIPYTTIIDQNAKVIRGILEGDCSSEKIVLEHHSNLDPSGDDTTEDLQTGYWRLTSVNWDTPIILTTMVQFMNCLFSSGRKSLRRMHNLANSVLIFDEVQKLPAKTTYMFNEAVNFLSRHCGSTAVLCTATQPLLDSKILNHPICLSTVPEITSGHDLDSFYNQLRRTETIVENSGDEVSLDYVSDLAINIIEEHSSILIIVNTKNSAKQIYRSIEQKIPKGVELFHLSTDMYPAHRGRVLESVRENLERGDKTICVSTQLIEAGVDIDFNVVMRSIAGLDSIAQAAGRCNREGKMPDNGKVYLVNIGERIESLEDIKAGKEITMMMIKNMLHNSPEDLNELLAPRFMEDYYRRFLHRRRAVFPYPYKDDSSLGPDLFSLLSDNRDHFQEYFSKNSSCPKTKLVQSFKDANEEFKLIDDNTVAVIVHCDDEAKKIISELCSDRPSDPRSLLRRAQRYSINILRRTFDELLNKTVIEISNSSGPSGIYYLVDGNYDKRYGFCEGAELEFLRS